MKNLLLSLFLLLVYNAYSIEYTGIKADSKIKGANHLRYAEKSDFPTFIRLNDSQNLKENSLKKWLGQYLIEIERYDFVEFLEFESKYGIHHKRYQKYFDGYKVEWATFSVHMRNGRIFSLGGNLYPDIKYNSATITQKQAFEKALQAVPAEMYMWESEYLENLRKQETDDINATWFPKAELVIIPVFFKNNAKPEFRLTWKFDIYAWAPHARKDVYVDAETSEVISIIEKLHFSDVEGIAHTRYSGQQTITTEFHNGSYRLRQSGRGNGIETYNMNMTSSYGNATDFLDDDNVWNNFNPAQDEVATDAHFATERMYDYLQETFGWNSINNNGLKLVSYVHYNLMDAGYPSNVNAFWNGSSMNYGDGSSTISPLTTLDIAGHEMAHGITSFSSGLIYQNESGAINEAFSDMFGTVLEFYARPTNANWTVGEDIGIVIRSLSNPKLFSKPSTYLGEFWQFGSADYGGVHTNCTVLAHWFYLLSEGGSGVNDNNDSYSVQGIGIDKAADIAFYLNTAYLAPDANHFDARFNALQVAIDLFGPCTPEVESVINAMYAVGIGSEYVEGVHAEFTASVTESCQVPFTVNFSNSSFNASSYLWDFGDGNTSSDLSPSHTYTDLGNFTVKLIADGGECGSDEKEIVDFISLMPSNPCIIIMPINGTATSQTSCMGKIYDSGGPDGNYHNNSTSTITIAPAGATNVSINFVHFDIEPGDAGYCNYDYIEVFDGPNTSSTSLGRFCNTTGNPGTISSTGNALTLRFVTDQALVMSGYKIDWHCNLSESMPQANFIASNTNTCTGLINFSDLSLHFPNEWLWNFGDGNISNNQNPVHQYTVNGTYNVSLTASNSYGSDTIIKTALIEVNMPDAPIANNDTVCFAEQANLTAIANGELYWYNEAIGGTAIHIGNNFITTELFNDTTFYVESFEEYLPLYTGETNINSGGSFFTSNVEHYLTFDCYSPIKLKSVQVRANSAGDRTILLRNSAGFVLQSKTINIPAGISRIELDFDIPAAYGLQLVGPASPGLYRSNSGLNYPYTITNILSIIGSSAGGVNSTNYYYYFYDWELKGDDCLSPRIPVNVFVDECLSVNNYSIDNLTFYPNPAKDKLFITNEILINNLTISDLQGRVLSLKANNNYIDVSSLSKGIYFITYQINNKVNYYKFIKE